MDNGLAAGPSGETGAVLCLAVSHPYIAVWSAAEMLVGGVDQWHKNAFSCKRGEAGSLLEENIFWEYRYYIAQNHMQTFLPTELSLF